MRAVSRHVAAGARLTDAALEAWFADSAQLSGDVKATVELMQVLARACGHDHLGKFELDDLVAYDRELAHLTGVPYAGVSPL